MRRAVEVPLERSRRKGRGELALQEGWEKGLWKERHVVIWKGLPGKVRVAKSRGFDLLEKIEVVEVIWHLWTKSSHHTFNANKAFADET